MSAMAVDRSRFLAALETVLGTAERPVPLHEPSISDADYGHVKACLDSTYVSTVGPYVERFETMLGEITGAAHVVATVNGTAALELACRAAGVGPGDEVLMPPLSFVATANAAAHIGAVPHFVDIDPADCGLAAAALARRLEAVSERRADGLCNRETGRRLAAVVLVHAFGWPADAVAVKAVADAYGLPLVEDAAEALGSHRDGRHAGRVGRLGILSFNGNKIVTTGGGGAVLTDDAALAAEVRALGTTAKRPHPFRYHHDRVAFNYRLPNLNAALGVAQLEALESLLARKAALAARYEEAFAAVPGVRFRSPPEGAQANHWLSVLELDVDSCAERDALIAAAHEAGFLLRPVWDLLHRLPMYAQSPRGGLGHAERAEIRLVTVPSSAHLA